MTLIRSPFLQSNLDILAQSPDKSVTFGVEVKTGQNPAFTDNQRIVYVHIPLGGLVRSLSPKIATFGFVVGMPLPPIPLYTYYLSGPGAEPKVKPLIPEEHSETDP
jgi:hypothetical protein